MKIPSSLLLLCILVGRGFAGEWGKWEQLVEGQVPGQEVEIRVRRDEGTDDPDKGYFFHYELRNTSQTHVAKVSLSFSQQDPGTLRWTRPDGKQSTRTDIAPMSQAVGTQYSPDSNILDCGALIEWEESTEGAKEKSVAAEVAPAEAKPEPTELPEPPVLLGSGELKYEYSDTVYSQVVVTVYWQAEWGEPSYPGEFKAYIDASLENYKRSYGGMPEVQFLSDKSAKVTFTNVSGYNLTGFIANMDKNPAPLISVLVKAPSVASPEGPSAAATPAKPAEAKPVEPASEFKTTKLKAVTADYEGYWFDPSDKDSKITDPNPYIYVRFAGKAMRVTLADAKRLYGVPAAATAATMTQYSEKEGKIKLDLGTHRKKGEG